MPVPLAIGRPRQGSSRSRRTYDAGMARARLVGINHVALEVGDVDAALALYGRLFFVATSTNSGTAVRKVEQLSVLVSSLTEPGE